MNPFTGHLVANIDKDKKMRKFSIELLLATLVFVVLVCTYAFFSLFDDRTNKDSTIQTQIEMIEDLNQSLNSFGELASIYPENRAMVIALAYTESRCDTTVVHKDNHTKGIGGIKDLWDVECEQNSLMAIEEVIENIREQYPSFSDYQVIKYYKGAKVNLSSTNQAYEMYVSINRIL